MKLKKLLSIVFILFLILSLVSCAPAGPTEHEYGFFGGIWHGLIFTFSAMGYFIFDIGLAAETNSGLTYVLGYIIGLLVIGIISRGRL